MAAFADQGVGPFPDLPVVVAVVVGLLTGLLLGLLTERLVVRPLFNAPKVTRGRRDGRRAAAAGRGRRLPVRAHAPLRGAGHRRRPAGHRQAARHQHRRAHRRRPGGPGRHRGAVLQPHPHRHGHHRRLAGADGDAAGRHQRRAHLRPDVGHRRPARRDRRHPAVRHGRRGLPGQPDRSSPSSPPSPPPSSAGSPRCPGPSWEASWWGSSSPSRRRNIPNSSLPGSGKVALFVVLLAVLLVRPAGLLGKET